MPTEAELHARLREAAVQQAARAAAELDALLVELNRLEDFERICASDVEVRRGVMARREELGRTLAAVLSHWKRVGARLHLEFDEPVLGPGAEATVRAGGGPVAAPAAAPAAASGEGPATAVSVGPAVGENEAEAARSEDEPAGQSSTETIRLQAGLPAVATGSGPAGTSDGGRSLAGEPQQPVAPGLQPAEEPSVVGGAQSNPIVGLRPPQDETEEFEPDAPTETPLPAPEPLRRPSHDEAPRRDTRSDARTLGTLLTFEARAERSTAAPQLEPWMRDLAKLLRELGAPRDGDVEHELVFDTAMRCSEWVGYPAEVQRLLVAHITARARRLQAETGDLSPWLDECTARLASFAEHQELGSVAGLGRPRPLRGSWFDDADAARERLVALLPRDFLTPADREALLARIEDLVGEIACVPEDDQGSLVEQALSHVRQLLEAGLHPSDPGLVRVATPLLDALDATEFRSLERAIREELAEREEDRTDQADPVPLDWPWWGHTRNKRAIMLGGGPRELARHRLERAFEFRSFEWFDADRAALDLSTLRARVAVGDVDMLIVHARFLPHEVLRVLLTACREHGVDWVSIDHGHGVERIRSAIERFTDPEPCVSTDFDVRAARSGA